MNLGCSHIMLNASDLERSRAFYIDVLGFPVIEEYPTMFAFRAGDVRFSVMGGGHSVQEGAEPDPNTTVMFRTDDIDATVEELRARGVQFLGPIFDAPGFMRHIALADPDNNLLFLAQYLRDPLLPVPTGA